MAESALAGVFREYALTYSVPTGEWGRDPDTGNPMPIATEETLVVNFEAYQFPQIVFQPGADPKVVRGKGRCVKPARLPSAIGPGSELAMEWGGRPGKLRITQVSVRHLEVVDDALGQGFIAEWHADG